MNIKSYRIKKLTILMAAVAALCPSKWLMAAMPTAVDSGSSGAATSGDWLALLTGYVDKGTDPIAWGVVIMTFIIVAVAVLSKFNEARRNPRPPVGLFGIPGVKTEYAEVWLTAVVGAVILLFVIFIVTQATTVI